LVTDHHDVMPRLIYGQPLKPPCISIAMPWNYRIDEERRLVITTAWDRLSGPDISDHQHALLNDPAFERDFFQFLDLGDVTAIEIDRVSVAHLARFDLFSAKSYRAFFAPNALAYGMSRMFIAFREANGGQERMQVFSDRHGALLWLGVACSIDHTNNTGEGRTAQERSGSEV